MIKRIAPRKYVVIDPTGKKKTTKPMTRNAAMKADAPTTPSTSGGY